MHSMMKARFGGSMRWSRRGLGLIRVGVGIQTKKTENLDVRRLYEMCKMLTNMAQRYKIKY